MPWKLPETGATVGRAGDSGEMKHPDQGVVPNPSILISGTCKNQSN